MSVSASVKCSMLIRGHTHISAYRKAQCIAVRRLRADLGGEGGGRGRGKRGGGWAGGEEERQGGGGLS